MQMLSGFLPLDRQIARARPLRLVKLTDDLKRVSEQIDLLGRERAAQSEMASPACICSTRVKSIETMQAAAGRVEEVDRQLAALRRTADDIRRQIVEARPDMIEALDPIHRDVDRKLRAAVTSLYEALAAYNAVALAQQEAGATTTLVPATFPHMDQMLRVLDGSNNHGRC